MSRQSYINGFCKKAAANGVDSHALAVIATKEAQAGNIWQNVMDVINKVKQKWDKVDPRYQLNPQQQQEVLDTLVEQRDRMNRGIAWINNGRLLGSTVEVQPDSGATERYAKRQEERRSAALRKVINDAEKRQGMLDALDEGDRRRAHEKQKRMDSLPYFPFNMGDIR